MAVNCAPDRIDRRVSVEEIHDGDTIALDGGVSLRLIGINTPELGRDDAPAEPYARDATGILRTLVGPGERLHLRLGAERKDRYGRLLAHAFLPDGTNLTAALLKAGAGAHLTIPPNLWGRECYRKAELAAKERRRGVWKTGHYRPLRSIALHRSVRGFRFVEGVVERVGDGGGARWINLRGGFAIRIPDRDLTFFQDGRSLDEWVGAKVRVRGWIYRRNGELRVTVHHPDAIRVLQ